MDGSGGRRLEEVDGCKRLEDMDGLEVEDVDGVGGLLVFNSTW